MLALLATLPLASPVLVPLGELDWDLPAEVRVRILESEATRAPLRDADVWAYASLRDEHEGAPVAIDLGATRTDADGVARFDLSALATLPPLDCDACAVKVAAYRDGLAAEEWVRLDGLEEDEEDGVIPIFGLTSEPGEFECVGRVLDQAGRPVAGVEVRRVPWDEEVGVWDEQSGCGVSDTDALGYFFGCVHEGRGERFAAIDPVHGSGSIPAVPDLGQSTIVLERSGPITSGRVIDMVGDPVPYARLEASRVLEREAGFDEDAPLPAWRADVDLNDFEVRADARGEFRLLLPQGTVWWMDAGSGDLARTDDELDIVHAGTSGIELRAPVPYARIFVRDEQGRLLRGVKPCVYGTPSGRVHEWKDSPVPGDDVTWLWREGVSDEAGGWSFDLRGLARVHVRVEGSGFDDWLLGGADLVPRAGCVVNATIVARRVPAVPVPRVTFLDEDGGAVDGWSGRLRESDTTPLLLTFDESAEATSWGYWLEKYSGRSSPCWMPTGPLHFEIRADQESYVLPARGTLDLEPGVERDLVVRSPGFGGRVQMELRLREGVSVPELPWHVVFDADAGATRDACRREVEVSCERDEDEVYRLQVPTILLEPGHWTFTLRGPDGAALAVGTVAITAREETVLRVEVER